MVKTTIFVSDSKVTGTIENVQALCNLSSVPHSMLTDLTANIPWLPNNLSVTTLYTSMLITDKKRFARIKGKKQYKITFVVDEDDKHYDHKIKNITKLNNWKSQGVIVVKKQKSVKKEKKNQGLKIRICNHHHSRDAMRLLTAIPYMKRNIGSLSSVELIATYGDRVNSVAGLTYILKKHNVPYTIEVMVINYDESWLSTHKKYSLQDLSIVEMITNSVAEEDKFWQYKTGCADCLITNEGKVRIKINQKKHNQSNQNAKQHGINMINSIINMMQHIVKIIKTIIDKLFGSSKKHNEQHHDKKE